MALTKPAFTVDGVMPATITGGLPSRREKGESICTFPSLRTKGDRQMSRREVRAQETRTRTHRVLTSFGVHFLVHQSSYFTLLTSYSSAPPSPFSPRTMTRTPRPSKFRAVSGPIPLSAPGPKSMACVAVSGKLVALSQCRGNMNVWSQSERVSEVVILRRSEPGRK